MKRRSRNEREPYSTKLSLPFVSVPWKKKGESCAWIIRGISHEGNEIYSQLFSRTVFERRMEMTNSLHRKRPDLSPKLRTRSYGNISLPLIFVRFRNSESVFSFRKIRSNLRFEKREAETESGIDSFFFLITNIKKKYYIKRSENFKYPIRNDSRIFDKAR